MLRSDWLLCGSVAGYAPALIGYGEGAAPEAVAAAWGAMGQTAKVTGPGRGCRGGWSSGPLAGEESDPERRRVEEVDSLEGW